MGAGCICRISAEVGVLDCTHSSAWQIDAVVLNRVSCFLASHETMKPRYPSHHPTFGFVCQTCSRLIGCTISISSCVVALQRCWQDLGPLNVLPDISCLSCSFFFFFLDFLIFPVLLPKRRMLSVPDFLPLVNFSGLSGNIYFFPSFSCFNFKKKRKIRGEIIR